MKRIFMKLKKLSIIKLLLYFFLISSSLKSIAISSTYSEQQTINITKTPIVSITIGCNKVKSKFLRVSTS